jgi:hypothetical protein
LAKISPKNSLQFREKFYFGKIALQKSTKAVALFIDRSRRRFLRASVLF